MNIRSQIYLGLCLCFVGCSSGLLPQPSSVSGSAQSPAAGLSSASVAPILTRLSASKVNIGDNLALTGSHLAQALVVHFDGIAGTIRSNTDTQIVVAVPAGAKTGTVSVSTSAGKAIFDGKLTVANSIIFVWASAKGRKDGSSWANAFVSLQDALYAAKANDQIWIAQGTYHPAEPNGDTYASFQMLNYVDVYGGFAGHETLLEQRDPTLNLVNLSGDLNDNDNDQLNPDEPTRQDNAFQVVNGADHMTLDGVTIRDGNLPTHNSPGNYTGAGMQNKGTSPHLNQVIFRNNVHAYAGGGMSNLKNSAPTLSHVRFIRNVANTGGGMYNADASPVLNDVTFSQNTSTSKGTQSTGFAGGGGMFNASSSPVLVNVTFEQNTASYSGGGMYNTNASPQLSKVVFSHNSSGQEGGGISNNDKSAPALVNVIFSQNSADNEGGGIYNHTSSPVLSHVSFSKNISYRRGNPNTPGFPLPANSNSPSLGGGMYDWYSSSPVVKNCLFWNSPIYHETGTLTIGYTTLENGLIQIKGGGKIIDKGSNNSLNPKFINPDDPTGPDGVFATADDGLRLQAGSPAQNTGNNADAPATDLIGTTRPKEDLVDRGAYEYVP